MSSRLNEHDHTARPDVLRDDLTPNGLSNVHHDQHASATQTGASRIRSYASGSIAAPTPREFELPSLPQALSEIGDRFSPSSSRLAGVSSILNPLTHVGDNHLGRRRKASELDSPTHSNSILPALASDVEHLDHDVRITPRTSMGGSSGRLPRRMLTPRSPSSHFGYASARHNANTATVNAQQSPFPPSPQAHAYTIVPGTAGVPPLPTSSFAPKPSQRYVGTTRVADFARKASFGAAHGTGTTSGSTSPATSYSSFSRAGHTPPIAPTSLPALSAPYSIKDAPQAEAESGSAMSDDMSYEHRVAIPVSSSGANVYQMMTLETTSGTVQLPVDVQAASRVADEKRKRNAGASARFRQRRKDKEREASTTISRLEQRLKEASDDLDWYKQERNHLASIILQYPGGERHFPRPPSPRRRRSSSLMAGSSSAGYSMMPDDIGHSPEEHRSTRRRTSTLSVAGPPAAVAAQTAMPAPGLPSAPSYASAFGSSPLQPSFQPTPGTLLSPPVRGALPSISTQGLPGSHQRTPGPLQTMQAPLQTGPWNPYAPDRRSQRHSLTPTLGRSGES